MDTFLPRQEWTPSLLKRAIGEGRCPLVLIFKEKLFQGEKVQGIGNGNQYAGQPYKRKLCDQVVSRFVHEIAKLRGEGKYSYHQDIQQKGQPEEIPGNKGFPHFVTFSFISIGLTHWTLP